jgi:ketosteroid isomerase-like protein
MHANAELLQRLFGAFGKDAMQISATFDREVVWRVPGTTSMSGEYRGRRDVVEFLRRTGLETDGTYKSELQSVIANDDWGLAVYRATGTRNGVRLDIDQALVVRFVDGCIVEVTAVPLDDAFDAFWR